jgi:hypothetical protein
MGFGAWAEPGGVGDTVAGGRSRELPATLDEQRQSSVGKVHGPTASTEIYTIRPAARRSRASSPSMPVARTRVGRSALKQKSERYAPQTLSSKRG